jgi:hypothetical protein
MEHKEVHSIFKFLALITLKMSYAESLALVSV